MGSSGFRKQHCRLSGKTIWKIAMEFANKQKSYIEKSSNHKRTRIEVQINKVHTINDTVKEKFNLMKKKKKEEGWNEQLEHATFAIEFWKDKEEEAEEEGEEEREKEKKNTKKKKRKREKKKKEKK